MSHPVTKIEPGEVYDVYTSEDGKKVEKMIQNASVTELTVFSTDDTVVPSGIVLLGAAIL